MTEMRSHDNKNSLRLVEHYILNITIGTWIHFDHMTRGRLLQFGEMWQSVRCIGPVEVRSA